MNDLEKKVWERTRKTLGLNETTGEIPIRNMSFLSYVPVLLSELSSEDENIDWIWEGFIARGHATLLSAFWKAGKSTLIGHLLKAIQEGKEFAGKATKQCKVLVLSEESKGIWVRRRNDLSLALYTWVICRPLKQKPSYQEWVKVLEELAKFCTNNQIDLFIIDTLSGFWNVQDENQASQVSSALLPLNYFLERNIATLLVHHFRKSEGDEGTAARGSGVLGSWADILTEFRRLDGKNPNDTQRQLTSHSRFEETPTDAVIELVDGEYVLRGTRTDVSKERKLSQVLLILSDFPEGLTSVEIWNNWDLDNFGSRPSNRTVRNYLDALLADGRISEIGRKRVGKTDASIYSVVAKDVPENKINVISKNAFEEDNAGKETDPSKGNSSVNSSPTEIRIEKLQQEHCRSCNGTNFWRRKSDGELVCIKCHPSVSESDVAAWIGDNSQTSNEKQTSIEKKRNI